MPELNISSSQFREIDWMAGRAYNLFQASVPVRFNGKRGQLEGNFVLVILESKTVPILRGREQIGMPKIDVDIEDLHIIRPNYYTSASTKETHLCVWKCSGQSLLMGKHWHRCRRLWPQSTPLDGVTSQKSTFSERT